MAEFNPNLWAPWRAQYIRSLGDEQVSDSECFLCNYAANPRQDEQNHVVCRRHDTMLLMNRFPYTNGHVLVAPLRHVAELEVLSTEELTNFMEVTRESLKLVKRAVDAQGYNVGMNFGRCAGAGLPGHLHAHVVPRWNGDTNFMFTVGDSRVISESLEDVYERLRLAAKELGLI